MLQLTDDDRKERSYFLLCSNQLLEKRVQSLFFYVTEYTGKYVYKNGNLEFFNHPEGIVEKEADGYKYVYQIKDIWRNTRITYSDANKDGVIATSEIKREQNYYPFGLEHQGYNSTIRGAKNNHITYQGQEFTEDLGLNTHEWRYRVSDPTTGRFWQIDPLAEDYMYNSTYAFQENKMGMGIELEGLEKVDFPDLTESQLYAEISQEAKAIAAWIGSGIDMIFGKAEATASKDIEETSGDNTSESTTVNTTVTAEAGFNFEKYINDVNQSPDQEQANMPDTPMVIASVKKDVTMTTKLSVTTKVTPILDATLDVKESTSTITGNSSVSGTGTVGFKGNGAYVSGTMSTNKPTKVETGLKVQAQTPKVNGFRISGSLNIGVRFLLDE